MADLRPRSIRVADIHDDDLLAVARLQLQELRTLRAQLTRLEDQLSLLTGVELGSGERASA